MILFGKGDGQDTLSEALADATAGKLNVLRFKSGVAVSEVSVKRLGVDLEVLIGTGSDKVTVKSFFAGSGALAATNPLQRIEFADGSAWDIAQIETLVNTPVNTAPVVNAPLADQSVQEGAAVSYVIPANAFTDADAGDVLTYSATLSNGSALPSWLSFNASTRAFSGTAPSTAGTTSIKVVVTDSAGATASDVFDLTVTAMNNNLPAKNLVGTPGNDTLFGDSSNNVLDGGAGNDTYYFGRGQGQDQIRDLEWNNNTDELKFLAGVQAEQLWFRNTGNDLEISIIGTNDKVTLWNWYWGEVYRVEKFQTADGRTLNAQNVGTLVNAMAGLAPPPLGQTTLSPSHQAALAPVFAANWVATNPTAATDVAANESHTQVAAGQKMSAPDSRTEQAWSGVKVLDGEVPGKPPVPIGQNTDKTPLNPNEADQVDVERLLSDMPHLRLRDAPMMNRYASIGAEISTLSNWEQQFFSGAGSNTDWSLVQSLPLADDLASKNGQAGLESRLHNLIDAMASFAPSAAGDTRLTSNEPDGFKQVIAVDWAA